MFTPAQSALVTDNLPLVGAVVRHLRARSRMVLRVDVEELTAAGYLGLCEAALRFDPARSLAFSTYAWLWIARRVRDCTCVLATPLSLPLDATCVRLIGARRQAAIRQALRARHLGLGEDGLVARDEPAPLDDALDPYLSCLSARYRGVVVARVNGDSFGVIGDRLGVSHNRARQIYTAAIARVAGRMCKNSPQPA